MGEALYDAVISLDVLYHRQVDPPRALAGMAAMLRPGGLLLINVAAMPCLERRHDRRVMGGRRYLADGLGRQVRAVGLQPESVSYWNSWLTPLLCGCRPGWKRCCRRETTTRIPIWPCPPSGSTTC